MKATGPTWQGRVLCLKTIVGESAELHVLKARHSNADEWWFEVFPWLVLLDKSAIIKASQCLVQLSCCGDVGDVLSMVFAHDSGPFGGMVRLSVFKLNVRTRHGWRSIILIGKLDWLILQIYPIALLSYQLALNLV